MICSDGLYSGLTPEKFEKRVKINEPIEKKIDGLVDAANKAGGKDNITVVAAEIP